MAREWAKKSAEGERLHDEGCLLFAAVKLNEKV